MPLPKSDFISDVWKEGIFGKPQVILPHHQHSSPNNTTPNRQQSRLLHRRRRHHLQRPSPCPRLPRRQRVHRRPQRGQDGSHGARHRDGPARRQSAGHRGRRRAASGELTERGGEMRPGARERGLCHVRYVERRPHLPLPALSDSSSEAKPSQVKSTETRPYLPTAPAQRATSSPRSSN